jgi:hypothetical protein
MRNVCGCLSAILNQQTHVIESRRRAGTVEFLLKLMRISHAILGITPAEPEDERRLLLLWIISLGLIIAFAIAVFVFLLPRIMR